jgi:Transcriptional regulators
MDFLNPPITRVKQPIENIGFMAFKLLLEEIDNKEKSTKQILLNPELIIRESVRIIN